jgi:ankyrin repeat protein
MVTGARRCTGAGREARGDARAGRGEGEPNARERSLRHRHYRRGRNDVPTLRPPEPRQRRHITSRYDGTALIAAAHLGHAEVVRTLIRSGAPLDHVNNLCWTAVIESIVLGDGGPRHIDTLKSLIQAGANLNLADRQGQTSLALAQARRY